MNLIVKQPQSVVEVAVLLLHFGYVDSTSNVLRQCPVLFVLPRAILDGGSLTRMVRIIVMVFIRARFATFE